MTSPTPCTPAHAHAHAVQFYEDDAFLCDTVAEFIHSGLAAGMPALLITTADHRKTILEGLSTRGLNVARIQLDGWLTLLDARELLGRIMLEGAPDEALFRSVVGEALEFAGRHQPEATVCAFGEMVDLLWKEGNSGKAIQLEELWNALAATHRFSLLCAYAMDNFARAEDAAALLQVCTQHDHVLPTERYTRLNEGERLRRIAHLEQRAQALQTELEYRKRLEERLRAAAAEATAASQAKSEFLAVMSHELRTPLNAIGGYVELLAMGVRGSISDTQRKDLRRIRINQEHLLEMVNKVLDYVEMETGAVQFDLANVSVNDALRWTQEVIAPVARAKGLRFDVEPCDEHLEVRADAERLRQALVNLLSNAVKFTDPEGQVSFRCAAREGSACFMVEDTGIGIPAESLGAIFAPFVQVHSDLTRQHEGTGLGLALSTSIAAAMGGSLTVESRAGRGSTFTLRIPLAQTSIA